MASDSQMSAFGSDRQTGLATIHEFMALEAEVDRRCRLRPESDGYGVVLVDVEGLRSINHEYGFDGGDAVLIEIAQRLRAALDTTQPLCIARVGGDEFAALFDGIEARNNVSQMARKIRLDVTRRPVRFDGIEIRFRLRTSFCGGPNRKAGASDLLWEVQWRDRVDANLDLHQRLEALERRDGGLSGQAADLRARLAAAEERALLSMFDELTGLRNRRGLKEVLSSLSGPRVVVFVDVDNLRELNGLDDQNWAAGDRSLVGVARLLQTLSPGSVGVRWGGDEFLAIVPDLGAVEAAERVEELIERARRELNFGDVVVTFSAGIAAASGIADHASAFDAARSAARTAKASGRARVIVAERATT